MKKTIKKKETGKAQRKALRDLNPKATVKGGVIGDPLGDLM